MAISAIDIRDISAAQPRPTDVETPRRTRPPMTVVATAAVALVESVALLAGALTGLDGILSSVHRPGPAIVLSSVVVLASWIVVCAAGAATLIDGAGRRLVTGVAYGELVLITVLFFVALLTPRGEVPIPPALPLPAVALLVLAVPVGKLLLAGSPTAVAWVAEGPRPRERRADPTKSHRDLCVGTLAVIGVVLTAVAAIGVPAAGGSTDDPGSNPGGTVSSTH
ncbi:hypothetical protein [Petropleomorpha daqingensis]|uniref:Uncharacterized protein n=1 Tax=Petropleomorpha daqingensis TaxID=2026353 RepID=A0A853CGX1_9ACTN|nr:hypothetical protein [Petropleomorpha daqingensis]NYJ06239.1 hypothetical protein [Petropleomorpha daqingensis]